MSKFNVVSALVVLPLAGGVTVAGTKPQEAPLGRPLHVRLTADEKPPVDWTVHVEPPLEPCWIVRLDGAHETL